MSEIARDKLAYLATPYTKFSGGGSNGHREAHARAVLLARRLLLARVIVFSPIVHGHPLAHNSEPHIYEPLNTLMLARSDILLVAHLDGWEESKGIKHEIAYFAERGAPIFDLDPVSLTMARRK